MAIYILFLRNWLDNAKKKPFYLILSFFLQFLDFVLSFTTGNNE